MTRWTDAITADSPLHWWRLGEASGNAADSGSGNKALTVTGSPTYSAAGALVTDTNTAVDLSGTGQYFSSATSNDVGDVFTIEAWLRRDNALRIENIYMKAATGPQFGFLSAANDLVSLAKNGTASVCRSVVGISDTNWHHVAVTKNGATFVFYVDGVAGTTSVGNQTMGALTTAQGVGASSTGVSPFDGRLDEVAVYSTALSAERILAHYREGRYRVLGALGAG